MRKALREFGTVLGLGAGLLAAPVALAEGPAPDGVIAYTTLGDYEDVRFGLEQAIVNHGLVIDYTAKIGDMLQRTGEDLGSAVTIYKNAETMQFCSAKMSRVAMEADPFNIAYCPYSLFIFETEQKAGEVTVGYRKVGETGTQMSQESLKAVNLLLDEIAKEAVGQE